MGHQNSPPESWCSERTLQTTRALNDWGLPLPIHEMSASKRSQSPYPESQRFLHDPGYALRNPRSRCSLLKNTKRSHCTCAGHVSMCVHLYLVSKCLDPSHKKTVRRLHSKHRRLLPQTKWPQPPLPMDDQRRCSSEASPRRCPTTESLLDPRYRDQSPLRSSNCDQFERHRLQLWTSDTYCLSLRDPPTAIVSPAALVAWIRSKSPWPNQP